MLVLPRKSRIPPPASFTRTSAAYDSLARLVRAGRARIERIAGMWGCMVEEGSTNLFTAALAQSFTEPWTSGVINGSHTVSIRAGSGSLTLSGGATGTVNAGSSLTFSVTSATVIFTPTGTPERCQLEAKPYATTWQLPGTARAAETLTFPTAGILSPAQGYIRMWVYADAMMKRQVTGQYPRIFDVRRLGGASGIMLYHQPAAANFAVNFYADDNTYIASAIMDAYMPDGWRSVEVKWSAAEAKVMVDGVARNATAIPTPKLPSAFDPNLYLGRDPAGVHPGNIRIGAVQIGTNYPSDAESLAACNAGGILPDASTTLIWRPRGARKLVL
jgi:hypothetical protein